MTALAPQDFVLALTRAQEHFRGQADLLVQGVVQTVFNEIQSGGKYSPGTPIDTDFARKNWFGGIGAEGTMDVSATTAAAKAGDVVLISNNLPYIRRLEFGFIGTDSLGRYYVGFGPKSVGGYSSQAPAGFVRLTLLHGPDIIAEVAAHVATMRV